MNQPVISDKRPILASFRAGNPCAYGFIVGSYYSTAYKIAFAFTHDNVKSKTIVSQVFERLWDERASIPDGSSIVAYLCKYIREETQ